VTSADGTSPRRGRTLPPGRPSARELLLAQRLAPDRIEALLRPFGLADPRRADALIQGMAGDPRARERLADIIDELLLCVSQAADPDLALTCFARFSEAALNRVELFAHLEQAPRTLELLARTFGASPFMAEILIRHPAYLYWVADPQVLHARRTRGEIARELRRALSPLRNEQRRLDLLRIFKRKELLHVGVRDLMRLATVEQTLAALSTLAEVLIEEAYRISRSFLARELRLAPASHPAMRALAREFAVLGLGKLGGGELNFSSDVDLVYIYASDSGSVPRSRAAAEAGPLARSDYFGRLARRITNALAHVGDEGHVYRVDLRLRPEGRSGPIAQSLRSLARYYATRGETWERLALLKAAPVAGNRALGERFRNRQRAFVFRAGLDEAARAEIRLLKQRIDSKIAARGQRRSNVKLGFGGIREIELSVQALQLAHGARLPRLRLRGTLAALGELRRARLLPEADARTLARAYVFLRDVENKLQMVSDAQTHSLPEDAAELRALALRLGFGDAERSAEDRFRAEYENTTKEVNAILRRVLY
jgi:glutamate-ammonia-ligase adenylyltransferase